MDDKMFWINVAAIIIAPVIAVWIGQMLQDRAEKRKDKMQVFKTLMTSRVYGWTVDSVNALNIVEVVFAGDEKVIELWRAYYEKLCSKPSTDLDYKHINDARDKLLLCMAKSLGYEKDVTWETIQNPYRPDGLLQSLNMQSESAASYLQLMKNANSYFESATRKNSE